MTEPAFFGPRIADSRRRADIISGQALRNPDVESRYVSAAIEELNITLEELRVADEELRQQNTELERSIERAEREHRRYYRLFEFAPIGLLVTSAQGSIREANRAASLLFTCERQHLIGKPIVALLDSESGRHLREQMARAFTTSGPLSAWATTTPGRGSPRRIILTLEADTANDADERRIRWAIQPKGSPKRVSPGDADAEERPGATGRDIRTAR